MDRRSFQIVYNDLNAVPSWDLFNGSHFPPCFHYTLQEALDCIVVHNGILSFDLEIIKRN